MGTPDSPSEVSSELDRLMDKGGLLDARLVEDLSASDYTKLTVIDVDVDLETAHARAIRRWWDGRQSAIARIDPLGGRYVNVKRHSSAYWDTDGTSKCSANARWVVEHAAEAGIAVVRL